MFGIAVFNQPPLLSWTIGNEDTPEDIDVFDDRATNPAIVGRAPE